MKWVIYITWHWSSPACSCQKIADRESDWLPHKNESSLFLIMRFIKQFIEIASALRVQATSIATPSYFLTKQRITDNGVVRSSQVTYYVRQDNAPRNRKYHWLFKLTMEWVFSSNNWTVTNFFQNYFSTHKTCGNWNFKCGLLTGDIVILYSVRVPRDIHQHWEWMDSDWRSPTSHLLTCTPIRLSSLQCRDGVQPRLSCENLNCRKIFQAWGETITMHRWFVEMLMV